MPSGRSSSSSTSSAITAYLNEYQRREAKYTGSHTAREIKALDVDTGTLSWYPRLIQAREPDITYILDKLSVRAGGYVIQLSPGDHYLNKPIPPHLGSIDRISRGL